MALVVKDRVKETTSTTGTSTLTLNGAVAGFQTFTSVLSNGDTTYYAIFESSTGQFEVGLGTFTSSGTTLARTTVLESSNSGNAINLTAGAADVFITQPAEKAVYLDSSGHIAAADGRNVTNVAASTATTLATARTIGGVSFDGSANINLPGVNTAGNQDTSGNAATATTAGTVTTAAQPNITSVGTLTTLTVDDITINGSTISDAGDLTVDVGGDIILDADGGDIIFADGGSYKLSIANSSGDVVFVNNTTDKDFLFKGYDGASLITALTLDMSAAGTATFNSSASATYFSAPNFYVNDSIIHNGDGDTYINFGTDTITHVTGGSTRLQIDGTNSTFYTDIVAEDHDLYVGNYSAGNMGRLTYDSANGRGFTYEYDNAFVISDAQGATEQYLVLGDSGASSNETLLGVSIYQSGIYYKRMQLTGVGDLILPNGSLREDWDSLSGTTPTVGNAGAYSLTMSGNTTFTFTSPTSGYSTSFILQLTGNGGTVTYPNSVDFAGGTAPDAPANGETDILVFWTRDGGTTWYGALAIDAAS